MATIADVAREAGVSVSNRLARRERDAAGLAGDRKRRQGRHRREWLSPQCGRALFEDGVDPISRNRHFGYHQSLLQRHHLGDRDAMRRARHDGVSLGHSGRPGARARGLDRASSASGRRRHFGAERGPGAPRAPVFARDGSPVRPCRPHARSVVRSGRRQQSRCDARAGRLRRQPRASPHRLCRRPSGVPDDSRAHHWLSRQRRAPGPSLRRALSRHRRSLDGGRGRVRRTLCSPSNEPPTAIVTGNNMATIGAMRAIRARGLHVPDDISIAGFDDFEWADCFEPRLTLVAQPCEEIGRRAAFLLMERIVAPSGARRTVRLDAALRLRHSCARPR